MPAISVDTFFACSLMVLLVLSAMAGASKLLYPYLSNTIDENIAERYREISRYLLLNGGAPSAWGQNGQTIPETFGLAETGSKEPYELDIDKVSRLNSENFYALSYAQMFTALKISDTSFRIEIKPIFEVTTNLTATFQETNETIYQFDIMTEKHGVPVQTELKCYAVAENHLESYNAYASNGRCYLNITIPNNVTGPALLAVFARSMYVSNVESFNVCTFMHESAEPSSKGTFLKLSPLNYTLTASFLYPEIVLSNAYALSFNYNATMPQTANSNESTTYDIPHFLDASPTLIIVAGWNSTSFFTEWTAYPQVPLQIGANFDGSVSLSNVFAYSYVITIISALYECTVWLGGPRE
jgi:hypothetical protein